MKLKKPKVWKCSTADNYFSKYIINRDTKCLRCGSLDNLTNSHYWRRGHSGTRFEPDNCMTMCVYCHTEWENLKNTEYRVWMINWLGKKRYDSLEIQARTFKNRAEAVAECKIFLASLITK